VPIWHSQSRPSRKRGSKMAVRKVDHSCATPLNERLAPPESHKRSPSSFLPSVDVAPMAEWSTVCRTQPSASPPGAGIFSQTTVRQGRAGGGVEWLGYARWSEAETLDRCATLGVPPGEAASVFRLSPVFTLYACFKDSMNIYIQT
jgi:hypothetical protein